MINPPKITIDTSRDYNMCFGCGRENPIGLKLSFHWDGETANAEFLPNKLHQGWADVVHGGIIACLLDEAMSYAALFDGMYCATTRIEIKFKNPAPVDKSLNISATVISKNRRLVETKASATLKDGTPIAEGTATHFVIDAKPEKTNDREQSKDKAVIWDMDGVIADTGPYHCTAWQQVFHKRGVNFTEEDFRHHFGQRNDTIIRNTMGQDIPQSDLETVIHEKETTFRDLVRHSIKALPGAINLIKSLAGHGLKVALASSAPPENINLLIAGLGIKDYFQVIVSGTDVIEGKPSPQGFLLAAHRLGVKSDNCVVVEDAVAGVAGAKRAGMRCIAVTNTHPRESLLEADLIIDTLEAVTVEDIEKLLKPAS